MKKVTDTLAKGLTPFATFMNNNKYVAVIRDSFVLTMGLIIAGSFALLAFLYICTPMGLPQFAPLAFLENYGNVFLAINFATISCMALAVEFLIGYQLGKRNGLNPLITGPLAVVCLITLANQEELASSLGASSLFLAFIVGFASIELLSWLMTFEKIKIKLPSSVPTMIAESFNSLIPVILVVTVFGLISGILLTHTGAYANDFIYKFVQLPFSHAVASQLGVALIVLVTQLLWWVGVHGDMALQAIKSPIYVAALAANAQLVTAGSVGSDFFTRSFSHLFICLGGSGMVLGLGIAILLFSKQKEQRDIVKVAFFPMLFGISEPMVFGLPIMLNPTYLIPFVLAPLVTTNIGYYAIKLGFLKAAYVEGIDGLPIFVQQLLGYSGQWSVVVLTVIVLVVATLIYAPFVMMTNKDVRRVQAD